MAKFEQSGYPVGSVCVLVWSMVVPEAAGKDVLIVGPKFACPDDQGLFVYGIQLPDGRRTVVYEQQLDLVKLPAKWENWCRNKVTNLLKISPEVAQELAKEKIEGDKK